MSDAAFLAGIAAHPADRVRRLVYADWLDESGDPRGELVRVEDAMLDLPVFADEFWRLKSRRNDLRAQAPADWLRAMRYGVDAHPVFAHGVPDDPRGRWRLIREFLERWHGVPMSDCGGHAAGADELLGAVGPWVGEFAALSEDYNAGPGPRYLFGGDPAVARLDGTDALAVRVYPAGEAARTFAVRAADAATADPPVTECLWVFDGAAGVATDPGGPPAYARLTDLVLEHALRHSDHRWGLFVARADEPAARADLARLCPPPTRVGPVDCYERTGVLVQLIREPWQRGWAAVVDGVHPVPPADPPAYTDGAFWAAATAAAPPDARPLLDWAVSLIPAEPSDPDQPWIDYNFKRARGWYDPDEIPF